jgi:hypothetical protein
MPLLLWTIYSWFVVEFYAWTNKICVEALNGGAIEYGDKECWWRIWVGGSREDFSEVKCISLGFYVFYVSVLHEDIVLNFVIIM